MAVQVTIFQHLCCIYHELDHICPKLGPAACTPPSLHGWSPCSTHAPPKFKNIILPCHSWRSFVHITQMKCIQYGIYGHVAVKNARTILFFEDGRSGQGAWASSGQWRRRAQRGPTLSLGRWICTHEAWYVVCFPKLFEVCVIAFLSATWQIWWKGRLPLQRAHLICDGAEI